MNRIEVCGGIASGKTTFANLMSLIKLEPLFENFKENPFWRAFYTNPGKYIFETEITFTLLHYHQIKKRKEYKKGIIVCDFSFVLDLAYAKIGLDGSKLKTFVSVYSEIYKELGAPSLLVYLKCDAKAELERIRRRGRATEKLITLQFLDALNSKVESEVEKVRGRIEVLTIESAIKDFAHDDKIRQELCSQIASLVQSFSE